MKSSPPFLDSWHLTLSPPSASPGGASTSPFEVGWVGGLQTWVAQVSHWPSPPSDFPWPWLQDCPAGSFSGAFIFSAATCERPAWALL